ncbi:MAG: phosphomethylpyrimidine synthase, partial [Verrucomicrobia bacterium]|nr:phosphomethylpyrimidine synthase [Verrucomicrobiota bacterium]
MIANKDQTEPSSNQPLPNSSKIYVEGQIHADLKVPMREIRLHPTHSVSGETIENEPVQVYDTSGPWGDPSFQGKVSEGLPALRRDWILQRDDVESYDGREVLPLDNGYLSGKHEELSHRSEDGATLKQFPGLKRKPVRASKGHPVTQLWYARQGIITP